MNLDSSENYSIGYNKDETYIRRVFASLKAESQSIWILVLILSALAGLDLVLNEWMGWNEFLLRITSAVVLFSIGFLLRPGVSHGLFKEELLPHKYAYVLLEMKKHYRITFIKVLRLILAYSCFYLALELLLRSEASLSVDDFLTFKWLSATDSTFIIIAIIFIYTLYKSYSTYSRLNKIEHI